MSRASAAGEPRAAAAGGDAEYVSRQFAAAATMARAASFVLATPTLLVAVSRRCPHDSSR